MCLPVESRLKKAKKEAFIEIALRHTIRHVHALDLRGSASAMWTGVNYFDTGWSGKYFAKIFRDRPPIRFEDIFKGIGW